MIRRKCLLVLTVCFGFVFVGSVQASDIRKVVSDTGIVAWFVPDSSVPLLALNVVFRGAGSATDPDGKEGLAEMTSSLLDEGAGNIASADFQRRLENIAAQMTFSAGRDHFSGRLRTLSSERDDAFDLLRLAISKPRFDQEPVERVRSQLLAALKRNAESPRRISGRIWSETVFAGHPYSRPVMGTEDSLAAISAPDLKSFVGERFTRDRLVIGVVGRLFEAHSPKRNSDTHFRYQDFPATVPAQRVTRARA